MTHRPAHRSATEKKGARRAKSAPDSPATVSRVLSNPREELRQPSDTGMTEAAEKRGPKLKSLKNIHNQQAVTYREFKTGKIERAVATARARILEGLVRTVELRLLERQIAVMEKEGGGVLEVRHVRGGQS